LSPAAVIEMNAMSGRVWTRPLGLRFDEEARARFFFERRIQQLCNV
jgi:hypothetical protein